MLGFKEVPHLYSLLLLLDPRRNLYAPVSSFLVRMQAAEPPARIFV